jgi:hypothetical protein
MANTYVAIATTTVGSGGASSIDFQSIPGTYTDLLLVISGRTALNDIRDVVKMTFNNNTSNNYTRKEIEGDGASAASYSETTTNGFQYIYVPSATGTTSTFGNCLVYIPNYTSSNNKSFYVDNVEERNSTTAYACLMAGLWSNTAVINRITLTSQNSSNFVQHSTATLYGIKNS